MNTILELNALEDDFIVSVLDLFEGQLTYEDVITMEIDRLHGLVSSKHRMLTARKQASEKAGKK
jgi:hypothetical protein